MIVIDRYHTKPTESFGIGFNEDEKGTRPPISIREKTDSLA
jgi:hypothetical protein